MPMKGLPLTETSESIVKRETKQALEQCGFTVLQTASHKRSYNTKGTPDLFVSLGDFLWIGIEMKRPGGRVRPEQQELARGKRVLICDNTADAISAVMAIQEQQRRKRK